MSNDVTIPTKASGPKATVPQLLLLWFVLRNTGVTDNDLDSHIDVQKALRGMGTIDETQENKPIIFKEGALILEAAGWRYLQKVCGEMGKKGWPGSEAEDARTIKRFVADRLAILEASK